MMKQIRTTLFLAAAFFLLQNNAWVSVNTTKPALAPLPSHIRSIVVIDGTLLPVNSGTKIEKVLTGEVFAQDEQAIGKYIEGIVELCSSYGRITIIRSGERYEGGGTKNTFPKPLDWDAVKKYCEKYNADAVMAIEVFDSDYMVTGIPFNMGTIKTPNVNTTSINTSGTVTLNIGLRIYDPREQKITDEYRTTEYIDLNSSVYSAESAVNTVLSKVEIVNQVSYDLGLFYGKRISPWITSVTRYFYNKPKKSKNLQQGVRRSEVADWKGAIESWTMVLESNHKKDKKAYNEAAFNIAVAWEVLGDLQKASEWARRAYVDYNDKDANGYYNDIQARIREEEILNAQLMQ